MKLNTFYWLAAGVLVLLLVLLAWRETQTKQYEVQIGLYSYKIEFLVADMPKLFLEPGSKLGYDGKNLNLETIEDGYRRVMRHGSYAKLQPGLWLLELKGERIFVFSNTFDPKNLDPTLAINFNSDWVVLSKSSLLPKNWPIPNSGWVVLNTGTLSKKLKGLSVKHQKPVIRSINNETLWLKKEAKNNWQVEVPR